MKKLTTREVRTIAKKAKGSRKKRTAAELIANEKIRKIKRAQKTVDYYQARLREVTRELSKLL